MFEQEIFLEALWLVLALALAGWLLSLVRGEVSFVDSLWSWFFVAAAGVYAWPLHALGPRGWLVGALVLAWALRLSFHITLRNWGQPEDYRYRAIRANNEPGFTFKSLYIVFGLQGLLAWVIALPLQPALASGSALGVLDAAALLLWLVGQAFEAGGDYQLLKFKADPANRGKVLQHGFWAWTRHPNYFGECCTWWGFYLFAVAAGGWWTAIGPLLLTFLLLKISGVAMLERTIGRRRPDYAEYQVRVPAFFPRRPR